MAIKRLHYFDHQFLIEADFTAQQNYHLDMRRRLNRLLNNFGIAEGLEVARSASKAITVRPGTAIDRDGREIILDAPRVIDLSNAAQFPAGATIFITAAYQDVESDPSTATGAVGNTRITEEPIILAVRIAPPTDGTVIRLASFRLDDTANVPGNPGDLFDGGVRQPVTAKGGLVSLDGVSNPGANVDLLASQSIVITPDDANNRITIGENHSARTDNPHGTTAAQIGAMLASDYDLRRRSLVTLTFDQGNGNGAPGTVNFGFPPKYVTIIGTCSANLGGRTYTGGINAFAFADASQGGALVQRCVGWGVTRFNDTNWNTRIVLGNNIFNGIITDNSAVPIQAEVLSVAITSVTPTGMLVNFSRSLVPVAGNVNLSNFSILLNFLGMG